MLILILVKKLGRTRRDLTLEVSRGEGKPSCGGPLSYTWTVDISRWWDGSLKCRLCVSSFWGIVDIVACAGAESDDASDRHTAA